MTLDYGSLDSQPDLCTIKFESHKFKVESVKSKDPNR